MVNKMLFSVICTRGEGPPQLRTILMVLVMWNKCSTDFGLLSRSVVGSSEWDSVIEINVLQST